MLEKNSVLSFSSQKNLDINAAQYIIEKAKIAIKEKGSFSLVLSGGTTPVNVYKLLAKEQVNFDKWHIYFGDERCFPLDHLERNSNIAKSTWLSKVNILKSNIFIIPAELGNSEGALVYEMTCLIKCVVNSAEIFNFALISFLLGSKLKFTKKLCKNNEPTMPIRAKKKKTNGS